MAQATIREGIRDLTPEEIACVAGGATSLLPPTPVITFLESVLPPHIIPFYPPTPVRNVLDALLTTGFVNFLFTPPPTISTGGST
jgi:hypothetical protein